MYTLFFRSAPYPLFTTFDAPDFQTVCTSRGRSNTPLQALTVANDEAFLEFSQGLAAHVLRADLDEPRQLVVTIADRHVEIRPRACDALLGRGEMVVRRDEPERGAASSADGDCRGKYPFRLSEFSAVLSAVNRWTLAARKSIASGCTIHF